jgi:tetratricopeptide (TPR) repeat protein
MRLNKLHLPMLFVVTALLAGCGVKPVDFDLEVKVQLDGRPVYDAQVLLDGVAEGATDANGQFLKKLTRMPEQPVRIEVKKDDSKDRTKTWENSFKVKPRKDSEPREKQSFAVALQRFVLVDVSYQDKPVEGATLSVDGKIAALSGPAGAAEVVLDNWPKAGLKLTAKKDGFGETSLLYKGQSGERIQMALYTEAVISIEALQERNAIARPIQGAVVTVAGREVGKTGANGIYTYRQKGKLGETVALGISAPGNLPSTFTRSVKLGGATKLQQFFYSASPERLRAALVGFASNTGGEDIGDVIKRIEQSFNEDFADAKAFKLVPAASARSLIQRSKLSYDKLKSKGWRGTPLAEAVDVLVFGSVARGEGDSYVVEVSFYEPDGKLVMTQAAVLGSGGSWRVGRAMSEIVSNVIASYPVAGVVTAVKDEELQISIGRNQFPLGGEDVFIVQAAKRGADGRISGYTDSGTVKVYRTRDDFTEVRAAAMRETAHPGDRVVRLDTSSRAEGSDKVAFVVTGGKAGQATALAGANLYIDKRWVGSTDRKGEASVQLRLGRKYDLMVYRHGYAQASRTIEPGKKGERFEFALNSFSSDLTLESEPSGAIVWLDDNRVGTTPISKAIPVTIGFHTLRVDAGNEFRSWEEVVEFNKAEENRTGSNRIVLYKDYLKLADQAESARQFDEAIRLYLAAPKEHPDYVELHHRLGQLYLDDKHDTDLALAEFERVQAIPEVAELVFKQYAVVYTNLGKAYYVKGNSLLRSNRGDATQYFAKAIKALDRARENTRFFPNERHDEAVHDTYYYRALAYHNLYQLTKREALQPNVEMAWNEYQDFFPLKLRGKPEFEQLRESGEKLAKQIAGQ